MNEEQNRVLKLSIYNMLPFIMALLTKIWNVLPGPINNSIIPNGFTWSHVFDFFIIGLIAVIYINLLAVPKKGVDIFLIIIWLIGVILTFGLNK